MNKRNTIIIAITVIVILYGAFVFFSGPSLAPLNEGMIPITPMTATTTTTPTTPTTTMGSGALRTVLGSPLD